MMIVLHTTRYGDTSLIVHGYTREEGRASFMLRGAFRSSGKRRPSHPGAILLHPLSIVDYVVSRSPRAGMAYLREFSPKYRLHSIREDYDKISVAMFISELLYRTLLHSERDEGLYDFLEDAVLRLEALEGSPANFHLWFLDRYSAYLGFPFEKGFDQDYNPFSPVQASLLHILHEADFWEAMAVPLKGTDRKELVEAVIRWLEYHTGSRIELRSLAVLHQIAQLR